MQDSKTEIISNTPTTSTPPKTEKPEQKRLSVWDTSIIDKISFTLKSATISTERNSYWDKWHGEPVKVIVISYEMTNGTDRDISFGTDTKMFLDGKTLDTYPVDNDIGWISPGRTVEWKRAFAVMTDATGSLELEYKPTMSFWSERSIYTIDPQ